MFPCLSVFLRSSVVSSGRFGSVLCSKTNVIFIRCPVFPMGVEFKDLLVSCLSRILSRRVLVLLQKLHSRILDLSAADLLLEPERSKAFLLSRHSDGPANVSSAQRTVALNLLFTAGVVKVAAPSTPKKKSLQDIKVQGGDLSPPSGTDTTLRPRHITRKASIEPPSVEQRPCYISLLMYYASSPEDCFPS